jgi:hypothetical protein
LRNAQEAFAGKYTVSFSTSIHFFDQTAHGYIHAVSDDLGMHYLGFYSAGMQDLLSSGERERLEKFTSLVFAEAAEKVPVQRVNPPLVASGFVYIPGPEQKRVDSGMKKVVIVTDSDGSSPNLPAMTERVRNAFSGQVEVINLHETNISGGCIGCCRCGYDNSCIYADGYEEFFQKKLAPADIIIMAGAVHDRYLSSTWKQFFDRSFFKGHIPALEGKQIAFVISGPLNQLPHLKEALLGWTDNGRCHALFVSDEVSCTEELDRLLDATAERLMRGSKTAYIPPQTFYGVGGHKIFRDFIFAGGRLVFQADYRYFAGHDLFDFPQAEYKTRLMNAILIPLTRMPGFRKKVFGKIKYHMAAPFRPVLENA